MKEPYDWDAYAEVFRPQAEMLAAKAKEAEEAGEKEKASEYYLYALQCLPLKELPMLTCTVVPPPFTGYRDFPHRDQKSKGKLGNWARRCH